MIKDIGNVYPNSWVSSDSTAVQVDSQNIVRGLKRGLYEFTPQYQNSISSPEKLYAVVGSSNNRLISNKSWQNYT